MRAEESLNNSYLVCEEEPENQAHQSRRQGKPAAEMLKTIAGQAERGSNAHGDNHHARNCPQAKQESRATAAEPANPCTTPTISGRSN